MINRCTWCGENPLYVRYHDKEWGVPVHNDRKLFEFLILEGAQAGLNWITILKKRSAYRKAFDQFDYNRISEYDETRLHSLLNNPDIIRNRLKIKSVVRNASAFIKIRDEFGSFNRYIWTFVDGKTIKNRWRYQKQLPASTRESKAMSSDLKKRGFTFVGPTICYAFMQATGMVNDHTVNCFRYDEL